MTMMISPSDLENIQDLIYFHAHKFTTNSVVDFNDIFQSGALGFVKCAHKFDPARNTKLSSYAYMGIHNEMIRQFNKFNKNTQMIEDYEILATDALWEILPDNLTDEERYCVELLHAKHTIKFISEELKIRPIDVKRVIAAAIEKIKEANA